MALTKINTNLISNNTVANSNIADNAVDATKIASNSILTRHIDDNQVTTDQIAANTVATANIADNAVDGTKIASNSILTRHIDDDQVTGAQLAHDIATSGTSLSVKTTSATANDRSGAGFALTESATDSSRLAQMYLDADNGAFGGGDAGNYFYIEKKGGGGEVNFINQDNTALNFKQSGNLKFTMSANNLHLNGGTDARIQLGTSGAGATSTSNDTVHIRGDGDHLKLMSAANGGLYYEENGTARFSIASGGAATFGGTLGVGAGSVSAPSLSFAGDTNTGLYSVGADNIGFATAGTARGFWSATQFNVTGNGIFSGLGTFGGTLAATGDLSAGGADFYVDVSANKVGLGRSDPQTELHLYKSAAGPVLRFQRAEGDEALVDNDVVGEIDFYANDGSVASNTPQKVARIVTEIQSTALQTSIQFHTYNTNLSEKMRIIADGKVGIGTTSPGTALEISRTSTDQTAGLILENLQAGGYGSGIIWESKRSDDNSVSDAGRIHVSGTNSWNSSGSRTSAMSFGLVGDGTFAVRAQINKYNGIAFGTDSADANTLNDYEEGTWTPNIIGTTGSAGSHALSTSGAGNNYTKIGNRVFFQMTRYISNKGSYSGKLKVTGLPYANDGSTTAISISLFPDADYPDTSMVFAQVGHALQYILFYDGARADAEYDWADIGTGYYLNLSGAYLTNS